MLDAKVLWSISYGLYVIASRNGGRINGQIANALIQVTSEPARVVFALNNGNLTADFVKESRAFSVSILSKDTPLELIRHFGFQSGREVAKFDKVNWKPAENGCPVLTDWVLAFLAGSVEQTLDLGTHTLFVGLVEQAEVVSEGEPMTYAHYQLVKRGRVPKAAPIFVQEERRAKGMGRYVCSVCGYVYDPQKGDPENGIEAGTSFEDLPPSWTCPVCGASKEMFEPEK